MSDWPSASDLREQFIRLLINAAKLWFWIMVVEIGLLAVVCMTGLLVSAIRGLL